MITLLSRVCAGFPFINIGFTSRAQSLVNHASRRFAQGTLTTCRPNCRALFMRSRSVILKNADNADTANHGCDADADAGNL